MAATVQRPETVEEVPAKLGFHLRGSPVRAGEGQWLRKQLGSLFRSWLWF